MKFYTRQARANNHEFREAACECFSELAQKIDRGAVQPLVPAMLAAILGCFRDSSWPVCCSILPLCPLQHFQVHRPCGPTPPHTPAPCCPARGEASHDSKLCNQQNCCCCILCRDHASHHFNASRVLMTGTQHSTAVRCGVCAQVREAACEACGQFAAAYPEETHLLLPRLWGLWFDHATENVPSVRETAAVALGNAVRAYGQEALDIVLPRAR